MEASTNPTTKPLGHSLGLGILKTTIPWTSPHYRLREDSLEVRGAQITYSYVEHPGAVFIVPVTDNSRILLIRSYRYPIDSWCWEIPAGTLADRPGTDPREAARQELEEELGATCDSLQDLGSFYLANGFASCPVRYYVAWGARINAEPTRGPLEIISEVRGVPHLEVMRMVFEGEILDGDSVLGLLLAAPQIAGRARG